MLPKDLLLLFRRQWIKIASANLQEIMILFLRYLHALPELIILGTFVIQLFLVLYVASARLERGDFSEEHRVWACTTLFKLVSEWLMRFSMFQEIMCFEHQSLQMKFLRWFCILIYVTVVLRLSRFLFLIIVLYCIWSVLCSLCLHCLHIAALGITVVLLFGFPFVECRLCFTAHRAELLAMGSRHSNLTRSIVFLAEGRTSWFCKFLSLCKGVLHRICLSYEALLRHLKGTVLHDIFNGNRLLDWAIQRGTVIDFLKGRLFQLLLLEIGMTGVMCGRSLRYCLLVKLTLSHADLSDIENRVFFADRALRFMLVRRGNLLKSKAWSLIDLVSRAQEDTALLLFWDRWWYYHKVVVVDARLDFYYGEDPLTGLLA